MRRSLSLAWNAAGLAVLVALLTLGCARKEQAAGENVGPAGQSEAEQQDAAGTGTSAADPPPVWPQSGPPPETSAEPIEDALPPTLYRGPVAGDLRPNPLRSEAAPLSLARSAESTENPLRAAHAFSTPPRAHARPAMGDDRVPRDRAPRPRMAISAREGSPPPAADDPPPSAPPSPAPAMAMSAAAAPDLPVAPVPVVADPSAYDVVQVFYGTDRAAALAPAGALPERASRFLPTAISVLITMGLGLIALAKRRPAAWLLVALGVAVSLGLGYQAASGTLAAVRRSGHAGPQYTSDRSSAGQVQLGLCEVTIPRSHQVGELEAPSILRLEVKPDAERHVVLRKTERLADERFYELLGERVAASPRKELFVFVHGFNVRFEDAARRTAQIHHDLRFEGAPIFFSWPAHDKFVLTYQADEANVSWSTAHLKQFLLDVAEHSQAQSINLIAHSMGNRALSTALKELQLELRDKSRLFNQVILAAPDIDADEFRQSIAPALTGTANRVTLYASARDEALAASQLVHRGPRAGDAGRGLVLVKGIDTIDVTPIDTSPWGHTYYGSSDPVLRDLGLLMMQSAPPSQRQWLAPAELEGLPYWIFQPEAAVARVPGAEPF